MFSEREVAKRSVLEMLYSYSNRKGCQDLKNSHQFSHVDVMEQKLYFDYLKHSLLTFRKDAADALL